jgi:hypothetical protein
MPAEIRRRCRAVEESYEFMLAFAQGIASEDDSRSGTQIREFLQRAVDALAGLGDVCATVDSEEKYVAFLEVVDRDARDSIRTIEVVLAQPLISAQLIDNLNASIHLRAVLADLFLLSDITSQMRKSPAASAVAG